MPLQVYTPVVPQITGPTINLNGDLFTHSFTASYRSYLHSYGKLRKTEKIILSQSIEAIINSQNVFVRSTKFVKHY